MSFRVEKVASTIKSAIGTIILNKIDDPDLRLISVSDVILTPDLKIANIYVSSFKSDSENILNKLRNASGYLRKELSKSVYLKYMPELNFFYDSAFEFDQKKVDEPGVNEQ